MHPPPDEFRAAMSRWASGVTVVAARVDDRVVATTVSAFMSLSLEPPLILVALGPNATVLPFLQTGNSFGVSILGAPQRRLATVFADPYPVGPTPFPAEGPPLIPGAMVGLHCTVTEARPAGDHLLVIAAVMDIATAGEAQPLIRFRQAWLRLAEGPDAAE